MPALKKYDEETQARAVQMYQDRIAEGDISLRGARQEALARFALRVQEAHEDRRTSRPCSRDE